MRIYMNREARHIAGLWLNKRPDVALLYNNHPALCTMLIHCAAWYQRNHSTYFAAEDQPALYFKHPPVEIVPPKASSTGIEGRLPVITDSLLQPIDEVSTPERAAALLGISYSAAVEQILQAVDPSFLTPENVYALLYRIKHTADLARLQPEKSETYFRLLLLPVNALFIANAVEHEKGEGLHLVFNTIYNDRFTAFEQAWSYLYDSETYSGFKSRVENGKSGRADEHYIGPLFAEGRNMRV